MRWTRKGIVAEIRRMKTAGEELNYSGVERAHLNLVRAAAWHFGNWRGAVEAAGIEYESIGKYRRWNRERVIARIRELHESGADLSWRAVSTRIDPPLAAAALRANGFANWREAIAAAGLQIESVARYRRWDDERVVVAVKEMQKSGVKMTSKAVQSHNQPLFCAARRRFGSWDEALQRAGIAVQKGRARATKNDAAPKIAPAANARVLATRKNNEAKSPTEKSAARKLSAPQATSTKTAAAKSLVGKKAAPKSATDSATQTAPREIGASRKSSLQRAASTRGKKSAPKSATNAAQNRREKTAATSATKSDLPAPSRAEKSPVPKSDAAPKTNRELKPKAAASPKATTKPNAVESGGAKAREEKSSGKKMPAKKSIAAQSSTSKRDAKNRASSQKGGDGNHG